MSFLASKAVPLTKAKNVTASIVSSKGASFLRLALDTTKDFGPTSTGKTNVLADANEILGEGGNIRVSLSAYKKPAVTHAHVLEAIRAEVATRNLPTAEEGETLGGVLAHDKGRGFTARGNTKDGAVYIDLPSTCIATLANPNTTFKERDAVAPPSSTGSTRLIATSSSFSNILSGKVSFRFNIMINIDQNINVEALAKALDVSMDDPLFTGLCGTSTTKAAAQAVAEEKAATDSVLSSFSQSIRAFLENATEQQIAEAVRFVLEAKVKISSTVPATASKKQKDEEAWRVLSTLQSSAVRSWFVAHMVGVAIQQYRLELVINGKDVSLINTFVPTSNAEVEDLFESASNAKQLKDTFRTCLLAELEKLSEAAGGATGSDSEGSPSKKKTRGEK